MLSLARVVGPRSRTDASDRHAQIYDYVPVNTLTDKAVRNMGQLS